MRAFKSVVSVLPGPMVLFVTKWLDLFLFIPVFVHPHWQTSAQNASLGLGSLVAVVLCLLHRKPETADDENLRRRSRQFLYLTLAGFFLCWLCHFVINRPFFVPAASEIQDVWFLFFVATMTLMVAAITFAVLSRREERSGWFWWI